MIKLRDLTVNFGGVTALDAITATFTAPVDGIIGPNGAGKTTTMNVISGFLTWTGRIAWNGEDIGHMPAHKRTRWGLCRSFQRALEVTGLAPRADTPAGEITTFDRRLTDVARCLGGDPRIVMFDEPGGGLSREEAGKLGDLILQVPALTGATVLVIDQMSLGLAPLIVKRFVAAFGELVAEGSLCRAVYGGGVVDHRRRGGDAWWRSALLRRRAIAEG